MTEKLLVTDTHPIIHFFCDGGKRLGKKALSAFNEAVSSTRTSIFVPAPVLWELSMLAEDNHIELQKPFSEWIDHLFQYSAINPLSFDVDTVKIFHEVHYHTDPFDRAIVATAIQVELPLITNDGMMHQHSPCQLIWD
ncbi:MAG: PIN domain-containing protein [Candidatus Obscuribacterales bacterium]|nr:PIN domain-containing protein [Candidatus Obscuribacterales bacterium]